MLCIKRLVPVGSARFCPSVAPLALASAVSSWLGTSALLEAPGKITFPLGHPSGRLQQLPERGTRARAGEVRARTKAPFPSAGTGGGHAHIQQ